MYLASPGRPTDIGLQLSRACYPCSRYVYVCVGGGGGGGGGGKRGEGGGGKGGKGGRVFISSVSSFSFIFLFIPCPSLLSPLLLFYLSPPFLWKTTQNDPQGLTC